MKTCRQLDCEHEGKPQSFLRFYKDMERADRRMSICKDCYLKNSKREREKKKKSNLANRL
jgi:hypothetical protein